MTLDDLINNYSLEKINTLTKYPSIPTYHKLGKKGQAIESTPEIYDNSLYVTEKIDGQNMRFIYFNDDYLIGERERLIYAKDDRVIVSQLTPMMKDIIKDFSFANNIFVVIFGELYGNKIQNGSKIYSTTKRDFRLFDVWVASYSTLPWDMNITQIAGWRENNNQPWLSVDELTMFAEQHHFSRVPYLDVENNMPTNCNDTFNWLKKYDKSHATLDQHINNNLFGKAEGVVIRSSDRKYIYKVRKDEYEKGFKFNWID